MNFALKLSVSALSMIFYVILGAVFLAACAYALYERATIG